MAVKTMLRRVNREPATAPAADRPWEEGDELFLDVPGNIRLHGAKATVESLTCWGAHVLTGAAVGGKFRALFSEMRRTPPEVPAHAHGHARDFVGRDISYGYTGDVCIRCQGTRVRRAGTCLVCEECGESSGC